MSELKERKCTACGGTLKVEGNKAVCEYCGSTYNIDDGISIKEVSITNIGNLLKRGREYLSINDFKKAKEYLEKAKDIDIENQGAKVFEQELKEREENYFSAKDALDSIEYQEHLKEKERKKKQKEIDKKIKDFGKVEEATLEKLNNTIWKSTTAERYYAFNDNVFNVIYPEKEYDGEREYTKWVHIWTAVEKIGHDFYTSEEYYRICYRPVIKQEKDKITEELDVRCLESEMSNNSTIKNNYDAHIYNKWEIAGNKYLIEKRKVKNGTFIEEYSETYEKIDELEAYNYFKEIREVDKINKEATKVNNTTKLKSLGKPLLIAFIGGLIIEFIVLLVFSVGNANGNNVSSAETNFLVSRKQTEMKNNLAILTSLGSMGVIFAGILIGRYFKKKAKLSKLKAQKEEVLKKALEIQKNIIEYKLEE